MGACIPLISEVSGNPVNTQLGDDCKKLEGAHTFGALSIFASLPSQEFFSNVGTFPGFNPASSN